MGVHIIVCIKSVLMHGPDERDVRNSESCELNPFDRPALEVALRMREQMGGSLTALYMGPEACSFVLQEAMAMGADDGVLVCDTAFAGSDTLATSTTLAAAIKKLAPFEVVLFGPRAADSDTGQVGPQTSVLLGLPMVTGAQSVEIKDDRVIVERGVDGFQEQFEVSFPVALTIHAGSVQPRDVGLGGIQSAFEEREIKRWKLKDLGLSRDRVGKEGSATRVISFSRVERTRLCKFMSGSPEEKADGLIELLLEFDLIR